MSSYEFVCGDSGGTNLHAGTALFHGNIVYYNLEGCQIVHYKDYISFGKAMGFLNKEKTYTTNETTSIGLGKYMQSLVGKKSDHTTIVFPKEVKYILDRTYDCQNSFYKNQSIFDEFREEFLILDAKTSLSADEKNRKNLLKEYLKYNESVDVSYRKGIFYPAE